MLYLLNICVIMLLKIKSSRLIRQILKSSRSYFSDINEFNAIRNFPFRIYRVILLYRSINVSNQ